MTGKRKPSPPRTATPRTGRPPKYDWTKWRRAYYTTTQSLAQLAAQDGAPTLRALEERSRSEEWTALRADYLRRTNGAAEQAHTAMVLDARRDMLSLGTGMMSLASRRLVDLSRDENALRALRPAELVSLANAGAEMRRKALGMDTINLRTPKDVQDLMQMDTDDLVALLGATP